MSLQVCSKRRRSSRRDEVVYVSSGDGTTSEGEFFEALNTACNAKLPVIFHIEDNGYAISVPIEVQTAGASITKLLAGYPNLLRLEFDGCCPEESYLNWEKAVSYARARKGPVLMHSHVIRPYSHSLSDDESFYRAESERKEDARRDPVITYRKRLIDEFDIPEKKVKEIEADIDRELEEAKNKALEAPVPKAETYADHVFSSDKPATSEQFSSTAKTDGEDKTMVDLINACMRDEMTRDPRIVVFGEDVADASRSEALEHVKGKGGVFKVTHGLQRRFGNDRVFNSPLAEANIVGRAVGMAMRGMKPVVEVQFFDYIWPAMMQIRSEMAQMRWRSNGQYSSSFVIRTTYGGYLKGGAVFHSQTGESIFAHIPGASCCRRMLSTPTVCYARRFAATTRCSSSSTSTSIGRPTIARHTQGPDFMIPFGKAAKLRDGAHMTIITYGGSGEARARRRQGRGRARHRLRRSSIYAPCRRTTGRPSAPASKRPIAPWCATRIRSRGARAPRSSRASPMSSLITSTRRFAGSLRRTRSSAIIRISRIGSCRRVRMCSPPSRSSRGTSPRLSGSSRRA